MWILIASSLLTLEFNKKFALLILIIALGMAFYNHILFLSGAGFTLFIAVAAVAKRVFRTLESVSVALEAILLTSAIALAMHFIPGFNNVIMRDQVQAGPNSLPFTLYFNSDKALLPFILLAAPHSLFKTTPAPPQQIVLGLAYCCRSCAAAGWHRCRRVTFGITPYRLVMAVCFVYYFFRVTGRRGSISGLYPATVTSKNRRSLGAGICICAIRAGALCRWNPAHSFCDDSGADLRYRLDVVRMFGGGGRISFRVKFDSFDFLYLPALSRGLIINGMFNQPSPIIYRAKLVSILRHLRSMTSAMSYNFSLADDHEYAGRTTSKAVQRVTFLPPGLAKRHRQRLVLRTRCDDRHRTLAACRILSIPTVPDGLPGWPPLRFLVATAGYVPGIPPRH